jgi:hypothetical protein
MTLTTSWTIGGVNIPDPHSSEPSITMERGGGQDRTLSGMLRVDTLWIKETWSIPMENIDAATYTQLKDLWVGIGPYVLTTPYGDNKVVKFTGEFPRNYPRGRFPRLGVSFTLQEV